MPTARVNNVQIFYEEAGQGEPMVLVHGSWADHTDWIATLPELAESFHVVAYDRRGHSQSERPARPGSRREDEDDLAALIETLDCAPAHLVGNSFGASIALGLAARRADLVRTVVAHEPPLLPMLGDDPEARPMMVGVQAKVGSVIKRLQAGDAEGGFRQFVDEVALGPGAWQKLPEDVRERYASNAPTFVDEQRDPGWASLDPDELAKAPSPVLLTTGERSPYFMLRIVEVLGRQLPRARVETISGAGHLPHVTHPAEYAALVRDFIQQLAIRL